VDTVEAGVSRVTITPPVGMYLIGFSGRHGGSRGVRDDLYATALAVSDGCAEAVVVSCDVLMNHPDLVGRVRHDASERTGVPGENVMFCATHTHSGPVTHTCPDSPPMYRAYVDNLAFQLAGLIEMAHERLAPATFGFNRGEAHIGINRRLTRPDGTTVIAANPEGPVDPEVGVLRVDTADGQPLAVVVNYACHAVVLGAGSNVISSDWPGAMRCVVEQVTGATCLFVQGAGADINPWPGEPTDREDVLERLGTEVGGEAIAVWAGIDPQPAHKVATRRERLLVPLLRSSQGADELPALVEMAGAGDGLTRDELQARLRESTPWTAEIVGEGDARRAAVELQAIRIGDVAVVSAAGEIFVKTGLAVKRRSATPDTMFAAYTNGSVGYFPLPEDYPRGGYEVDESYLFYQLPAPVAPEAAGLIEEGAVRLLNEVAAPE
jgi:neutral ceramidase